MIGFLISGALRGQSASKNSKLLPDHLKVQFAGGIGFVSVGAGYETKNKKWEADFYYGYVPKNLAGVRIHSLTGKATWFPLKVKQYKTLQVKPLSFGLLTNYIFGKQYFLFSPEYFPYRYYNFPTAAHVGIFVGGQVNKRWYSKKVLDRVGLYYELGTSDKELISYVNNSNSLTITQIFQLGIGLKASF